MFCPNCNTRLGNNQTICHKCEYNLATNEKPKVTSSQNYPSVAPSQNYPSATPSQNYPPLAPNYVVPVSVPSKATIRNNDLMQLDNMISYFYHKQDKYDAYDHIAKQMAPLLRLSKAPLIWGIILCSFALFFLMVARDEDAFYPFAGILALAGGGLMTLFFVRNGLRYSKLNATTMSLCALSSELLQHYYGYPSCPIGPQYSNPKTLQAIKRTILSGKADTIKDALSVLSSYTFYSRGRDYAAAATEYIASLNRGYTCACFSSGDLFNF